MEKTPEQIAEEKAKQEAEEEARKREVDKELRIRELEKALEEEKQKKAVENEELKAKEKANYEASIQTLKKAKLVELGLCEDQLELLNGTDAESINASADRLKTVLDNARNEISEKLKKDLVVNQPPGGGEDNPLVKDEVSSEDYFNEILGSK